MILRFFIHNTISLFIFLNYFEHIFSITPTQKIFIESISKNDFLESRSKQENLKIVKSMFYFGYDSYMKYAHPLDELDPIHCTGRGPDMLNRGNININDVLGDYQLTLVDSLDTLLIMNDTAEFKRVVKILIDTLHFDTDSTVQVFEATIRIIGSLLSAHLLIVDDSKLFGDIRPANYSRELLELANDLAVRLMVAFSQSATGIPHPRVHLRRGVPLDSVNESCLAGATTLLLEFGTLSRLLQNPVYERAARRTINTFWKYKSNVTGLLGNVINIQSGRWVGSMSGLGAGQDSFYEYLLKGYIAFGDTEFNDIYAEAMSSIRFYQRKGRTKCSSLKLDLAKGPQGLPPLYVNVKMQTGEIDNHWIDSLQASLPMLLTLNGDVDEAICIHAYYFCLWRKYHALPERYNWHEKTAVVNFYPLRPELAESTYYLYLATGSPFYLHVGQQILDNLNRYTKTNCGYATVHDVTNMSLEDRMESFFLSETCKYLYLLFDDQNPLNLRQEDYIFTTQGHFLSIRQLRKFQVPEDLAQEEQRRLSVHQLPPPLSYDTFPAEFMPASLFPAFNFSHSTCEFLGHDIKHRLPLSRDDLQQIISLVG